MYDGGYTLYVYLAGYHTVLYPAGTHRCYTPRAANMHYLDRVARPRSMTDGARQTLSEQHVIYIFILISRRLSTGVKRQPNQ